MPGDIRNEIQRVARGLQNVLNLFGAGTPSVLKDDVQGTLELLQYFALNQRTVDSAVNAALAEGGAVQVQLPDKWCVLFAASFSVTKTATMTALTTSIAVNRGLPGPAYDCKQHAPFGATETGPTTECWFPPYLLLCPPNSSVAGGLNILGTDATANCTLFVEYGLFG